VPYANCKDIADPEMFFQAAASTRRHHDLLSRICDSCVVRAECLEHALVYEERGWWGGTSEEDRARILGEA
jgi:WhiB family redox-sensing transcriptional regulator